MKRIFLLCSLSAFVVATYAQKKLTPVTNSTLTGIGLPNGSNQDGRIFSVAAAATLLETESNKTNTKVQNTEVLLLPPASSNKFNKDSLIQHLTTRGWKITPTENNNYLWLQKDKRFVIAYFSIDTKVTNLYFAEAISTPDFNAQAENTTGKPPVAAPVILPATQPIQNTNKTIEPTDEKQQSNTITNPPVAAVGSLTNYVWKSNQNRKDAMGNYAGYSTNSYQFYSNGTYKFSTTTFQFNAPKYYMVYEDGTYQIDGIKITLKPVTSKFEVRQQEKTDPALKSGNLGLDEVQYRFEFTTIYNRQRLILAPTTSKETKRDGGFNFYSDGAMTKSYIYDAEEKPATQNNNNQSTQSTTTINSPIIGTWRRGKGVTGYGGRWSATGYQYTFNANGTYSYIIKTYVEDDPETLLTRESGSYSVNGNTVTLDPKTNVIEAWSKFNGGDNYKALITTQNKPLEKITYEFKKHFFPELKETDLVLIYGNETVRDGKYNATDAFPTGWRFSPAGPDYKPIQLPGEQQITTQEIKKDPAQQSTPIAIGKFAFSTTNFDDGWVSTVQEDWVQVVKGNVKVLIHYPNKNADAYNSVLMDGLKNAWNILVAPKYSTASNFEFKPISSWQSIEFAEADAVEKTTNKSVHIVLFKMNYSNGNGKYIEFITPDKKTYEQEFGPYHETSYGWEKLERMANYNKFALAATDLAGKWTNDFSGALQYVNAYTGANAGMNTHASNESFEFMTDNTYKWDLGVASGMVGNIKFQSVKSSGKFSLPSNWQIIFSDIEGKARTYNVFFSCVKDLRILWLDDKSFARIE